MFMELFMYKEYEKLKKEYEKLKDANKGGQAFGQIVEALTRDRWPLFVCPIARRTSSPPTHPRTS